MKADVNIVAFLIVLSTYIHDYKVSYRIEHPWNCEVSVFSRQMN